MTFHVGSTNGEMLTLTIGMPSHWRLWMRWWEPIENILDNAWSCDLVDDWEEHLLEFARNEACVPPEPEYPKGLWEAGVDQEYRTRTLAEYSAASQAWHNEHYPTIEAVYNSYDGDDERWQYERRQAFLNLLNNKRDDECMGDVKQSIQEYGFIRPLTVRKDDKGYRGYQTGDGHHRMAAAIDLGYTHIPLQFTPSLIAHDSGSWEYGEKVARRNSKNLLSY